MDYFSSLLVEEDIVTVSITKAKDVSENTDGCSRSRVCKPSRKPVVGVEEMFHEKETQDRVEIVDYVAVGLYALRQGLALCVCNLFAAAIGLVVFREVSLVRRKGVLVERNS